MIDYAFVHKKRDRVLTGFPLIKSHGLYSGNMNSKIPVDTRAVDADENSEKKPSVPTSVIIGKTDRPS